MGYYSDDPVRDAERYLADQDRKQERLPECSECGYTIYEDYCYSINDEVICQRCLDLNHRKNTEDVI